MNIISREERGLPQHPAWTWVDCPACGGSGEIAIETGRDPQLEDAVTCDRCFGEGVLWDSPRQQDPLHVMRRLRRTMRANLFHRLEYAIARRAAARPVRIPSGGAR